MSIIYEVTLDDGMTFKVMADFVDVLDGPSRCVRFVRQKTEDEAIVHAVYFGVKSLDFVEFADVPGPARPAMKKTAKRPVKKST